MGLALATGLGKLAMDMKAHRRQPDRPLAPWEREPGPA